jgi:long-chain acyl-CoA synthetase
LALGAVAVPLDAELGDQALACQLQRAHAKWVLATAEIVPRAETLARAVGGVVLELSGAAHPPAVPTAALLPHTIGEHWPALVCFTSGTTGKPKGVVITHANLRFQIEAFAAVFPEAPRTLAMLPPHHLFGLTVDLLGCLSRGGTVAYCPSLLPADFERAITWAAPNCIIAVPRFLTALQATVQRRINAQPRVLRAFTRALLRVAEAVPWVGARRLVTWPLRRRIAAGLRTFIVGGAPADAGSSRFFERLGISVLTGYGMSETSPVISFNTHRERRPDSVGLPLPGVEVRCLADGEVVTRGPHVMAGYLDDPIATSLVLDPLGWLRTGDVGRLDADGFLYLRGRRKDLIVLANGRKVHPDAVETPLLATRTVAEGAILGAPSSRQPGAQEVVAVIVPAPTLASLDGEQQLDAIRRALAETSESLARFERPTRVVLHPGPLPRTATGKVQREALSRWLAKGAFSVSKAATPRSTMGEKS